MSEGDRPKVYGLDARLDRLERDLARVAGELAEVRALLRVEPAPAPEADPAPAPVAAAAPVPPPAPAPAPVPVPAPRARRRSAAGAPGAEARATAFPTGGPSEAAAPNHRRART